MAERSPRTSCIAASSVSTPTVPRSGTSFGHSPTPYPFVCDPDKRLFAVYGLGDRGALEATRSAVVSFSYAFTHGDTGPQLRGAWLDVMNRNFVRRLHHHAMTAMEQDQGRSVAEATPHDFASAMQCFVSLRACFDGRDDGASFGLCGEGNRRKVAFVRNHLHFCR